jgi:hypothetical protein
LNKTRRDVLSSDLGADLGSSDDSLPLDLATALLGKPRSQPLKAASNANARNALGNASTAKDSRTIRTNPIGRGNKSDQQTLLDTDENDEMAEILGLRRVREIRENRFPATAARDDEEAELRRLLDTVENDEIADACRFRRNLLLKNNEPNSPESFEHRTVVNTLRSGADALSMIQQMYMDQTRPNHLVPQSRTSAQKPGRVAIDLISPDPSPVRHQQKPPWMGRANSFDAASLISNSPNISNPGPRPALSRATTLPVTPTAPTYHEISDDDEDLCAAIAASLADMSTPKPSQQDPSFVHPDSLFRSSPPSPKPRPIPSTTAFRHPSKLLQSSPSAGQISVTASASQVARAVPCSQGPDPHSSQIRDDTKRMLLALDEVTTNIIREKDDKGSAKLKKKASKRAKEDELESTPKPKKRRPTQKVQFPYESRGNIRIRVQQLNPRNRPRKRPNVSTKYSLYLQREKH